MTKFYDFSLTSERSDVEDKAAELGWSRETFEFSEITIQSNDWGEIKRKVLDKHKDYDIIKVEAGEPELNRKIVSERNVDFLMNPGVARRDPGVDHVTVREAAENGVAIGFSFSRLIESGKERVHALSDLRKVLRYADKYDAAVLFMLEPEDEYDLRAPRDVESIIKSLGYTDFSSINKKSGKIMEKIRG